MPGREITVFVGVRKRATFVYVLMRAFAQTFDALVRDQLLAKQVTAREVLFTLCGRQDCGWIAKYLFWGHITLSAVAKLGYRTLR